jgi:2-phospho-L-lactate guanylyltransferase (CobY/MobA/RfbA family)
MNPVENLAILVPLKAFSIGKSRLRDGGIAGVDEMARVLAANVMAAALPRPLFVACESPDVATFTLDRGAQVITSSSLNLNEAVSHSYRVLSETFEWIVIAHGDIRDPEGLRDFTPLSGVTVIVDSHGTGTNVLALPNKLPFAFSYGQYSAQAHQLEAQRLGLECHVEFNSPGRFDVDEPTDLLE